MNEQGWIDWHGGECPLQDDALVEVRFRPLSGDPAEQAAGYGSQCAEPEAAGVLTWEHRHLAGDIIAYRIVEPGK